MTDHRINFTTHNLNYTEGEFEEISDALIKADREAKE